MKTAMAPIDVVTLAKFNLRICQQCLAMARMDSQEVLNVEFFELRFRRALDLLWSAQKAAGIC